MDVLLYPALDGVLHVHILLLYPQSYPKSPFILNLALDLVEEYISLGLPPCLVVGVTEGTGERGDLLDAVGAHLFIDAVFAEAIMEFEGGLVGGPHADQAGRCVRGVEQEGRRLGSQPLVLVGFDQEDRSVEV